MAAAAAVGGGGGDYDEGMSTLPTAEEIARRGQLRGLGEELMRVDADNQRTRRPASRFSFRCSWFTFTRLGDLLRTAAPDLDSTLKQYMDATLMEAHGEEFLELVVNKAPDALWMQWLFTSLKVAARADNIGLFHRLFALCESDPEFWGERRIAQLLEHTASGGSAEVLSTLLEVEFFLHAARARSQENHQEICSSALVGAALRGHRSCVALLIKAGVSLMEPIGGVGMRTTLLGGTALEAAVERGHEGVVLELLAGGVDVSFGYQAVARMHSQNYLNRTPRGIAVANPIAERNESMMSFLVTAGADFGKNRTDTLPLIVAASAGYCGSLKRLLEAGADANVVNSRGQSALYMACLYNREGAVELLLRHNASVTSRCDEGLSPCNVVATGIVHRHRHYPSKLRAVETVAADRIRGMLLAAGAWARRGWLVMMRARRLVTVQPADDSSLENPSPAGQVLQGNDDETKEPKDRDACKPIETLSLRDVPSTGTPGGVHEQERHVISTKAKALSTGEGHDSGRQVGRGGGWECAVEWLLQYPDERGVFREILRFL